MWIPLKRKLREKWSTWQHIISISNWRGQARNKLYKLAVLHYALYPELRLAGKITYDSVVKPHAFTLIFVFVIIL